MPKIFIGADHAGYELKERLKPFLAELGYEVEDCGASSLDLGDDYPDFILPCAKKVTENQGSFGIVIGASGQGEAMAANSVPGARAAVYYGEPLKKQTDSDGTELAMLESVRNHNDANILSLGARFLSDEEAKEGIRRFLGTAFSGDERHVRRLKKY